MHTLKLRHETTIHALTSKVWKVLTSREYTEQFLFEGELVSDWAIEGPILLEVEDKGQKQVINKGIIEEIVPGISLKFKISGLQYSDDPVIFHYELIPEEGGIRLILSVEVVFIREELQKMMGANCKMMLQKIKWLAEYS
jgi:uncharacterized protein YndB with AHSA1/START domain